MLSNKIKAFAKNLSEQAVLVESLPDEEITKQLDSINEQVKGLELDVEKAIKAINRARVVLNSERIKRNIKDQLDKQISIFDYDGVEAIENK